MAGGFSQECIFALVFFFPFWCLIFFFPFYGFAARAMGGLARRWWCWGWWAGSEERMAARFKGWLRDSYRSYLVIVVIGDARESKQERDNWLLVTDMLVNDTMVTMRPSSTAEIMMKPFLARQGKSRALLYHPLALPSSPCA